MGGGRDIKKTKEDDHGQQVFCNFSHRGMYHCFVCMTNKYDNFRKQRPARGALMNISSIISHESVTRMVFHEVLWNQRAIASCTRMNETAAWPSNIRSKIEHFVGCKFHFIFLLNVYKSHQHSVFEKTILNFWQHSEFIVLQVHYYSYAF